MENTLQNVTRYCDEMLVALQADGSKKRDHQPCLRIAVSDARFQRVFGLGGVEVLSEAELDVITDVVMEGDRLLTFRGQSGCGLSRHFLHRLHFRTLLRSLSMCWLLEGPKGQCKAREGGAHRAEGPGTRGRRRKRSQGGPNTWPHVHLAGAELPVTAGGDGSRLP